MCNWESKINGVSCERSTVDHSEFCLFHKPDKSAEESERFWKAINWYSLASLNSVELEFALSPWEHNKNPEFLRLINEKVRIAKLQNFTDAEKEKADFAEYYREIENEVRTSNIWIPNACRSDFRGFVFPRGDVRHFKYSQAQVSNGFDIYDFSEALFEGPIIFDNYVFRVPVLFINCQFNAGVRFNSTTFMKLATFTNVQFQNIFLGSTGIFEGATFNGSEVIFSDANTNSTLNLKGIQFGPYTAINLSGMSFGNNFGIASYGEVAYRIAKIQSNRIGDFNAAAEYFYLEKCYKGFQILSAPYFWDKTQKGIKKFTLLDYIRYDKPIQNLPLKIFDYIAKSTIGYGERPFRALVSSVVLMVLFAILYLFHGNLIIDGNRIDYDVDLSWNPLFLSYWTSLINNFVSCLYFSVVTFTTVGYGDITPYTGIAKFLSALEMLLGVTFIGAWTATLLRKFIK